TEEVLEGDYPAGQPPLENGAHALIGSEYFERTGEGSLRRTTFTWEISEPFQTPVERAIVDLDRVVATTGEFFGFVDGAGELHLLRARETENLMTGDIEYELEESALANVLPNRTSPPTHIYLGSGATQAFVSYADGVMAQLSLLLFSKPELVETVPLVAGGRALDRMAFLPGRSTLLVSDSAGVLSSWFTVRPEDGGKGKLTHIQDYGQPGAPLSALGFSGRSRLFLAGRRDGRITAWQGTLGTSIQTFEVPSSETILQLAFHPRQDGIVALTDKGLHHWRVDFGYPEASLASLFLPIRYEGST
ncbi:MAG: hypothetical protein KDB61_15950, partial [Planctomycetes bacterium]|nr:hypothetical protein [Planctomycetota bacterium]